MAKLEKKNKAKVKISKRPTETENDESSKDKTAKLAKLDALSKKYLQSLGVEIPAEKSTLESAYDEIDSVAVEEGSITSSEDLTKSETQVNGSADQPKVYKFTDNFSKLEKTKMNNGYKKFMSNKVGDLDKISKPIVTETKEEEAQETRLRLQDKELEELLNSSNLIERVSTSELYGKSRRKHMLQMMEKGGAKVSTQKMPINERFKQISTTKRKEREAIEKAKEEGNYHASIKHTFTKSTATTKPKSRPSKGSLGGALKVSKGRVKDGLIEISKSHIKKNAFLAKQKGKISRFGKGNIKL